MNTVYAKMGHIPCERRRRIARTMKDDDGSDKSCGHGSRMLPARVAVASYAC